MVYQNRPCIDKGVGLDFLGRFAKGIHNFFHRLAMQKSDFSQCELYCP